MLESLTLELCFLLLLKIALLNGAIEIQKSSSKCRLPGHLQGVYLVQKVELNYNRSAQGVLRSLKYDDVYIGPTFISKWGDCVEALGHSYILRSRKTNGSTCFKCLTILQRTPNVVQVLTSQKDSCHKSEAIAKTNCKSLSAEFPGEGIMLWKSEDVQYQLCPINGMAELTYIMSDGFQRDPEGLKLTASNCKYGYQLDVQFEDDKAVTNGKEGYENYSPTFCMDDRALADIPWTVLSVTDPATFVACSYAGHYVSKEERAGKKLCYSLSTDCHHTDQLIKTTFYCQTGELLNGRMLLVFSVQQYFRSVLQFGCLASWKEDEYYFDYVKLHDSNRRGCFTSRLHKGKLYVIWTGKECQRNVDFEKLEEEYDEKLIILSQKSGHTCHIH
ncbi:hypothetical protein M513_09516 [Trichuris suis]|uniref:Uncharacterized protein n=1 Tax=Trichuris suis TaxID=68888 RepID=A0A085LX77_9BILA|nr:hypothetical protein M513_09516 [Trichuris suis]